MEVDVAPPEFLAVTIGTSAFPTSEVWTVYELLVPPRKGSHDPVRGG